MWLVELMCCRTVILLSQDRQRARGSSPLRAHGPLNIPSNVCDLNNSDALKSEEQTLTITGRAGRTYPNLRTNKYVSFFSHLTRYYRFLLLDWARSVFPCS